MAFQKIKASEVRRRAQRPAVPLAEAQLRRIAVASDTDPRTVRRVVLGLPTRQMAGERITRAIHDLGFGHLLRRTG